MTTNNETNPTFLVCETPIEYTVLPLTSGWFNIAACARERMRENVTKEDRFNGEYKSYSVAVRKAAEYTI
jgi:hypothetical protein